MTSEPTAQIILEAHPGEQVERFAARLVALSWSLRCDLVGRHNEMLMPVRMGMTREQVLEPWNRRSFDSYFGEGEWDRKRHNGRGS